MLYQDDVLFGAHLCVAFCLIQLLEAPTARNDQEMVATHPLGLPFSLRLQSIKLQLIHFSSNEIQLYYIICIIVLIVLLFPPGSQCHMAVDGSRPAPLGFDLASSKGKR